MHDVEFSLPRRGVEHCDVHICLCVCLSASIFRELHLNLYQVFMRVTYGCGPIDPLLAALPYVIVFPVLRMTLYLHIMVRNNRCEKGGYSK